jgi:hypothetical protein
MLEADVTAYRLLASQTMHYAHELQAKLVRLQRRLDALRDEDRRLREPRSRRKDLRRAA